MSYTLISEVEHVARKLHRCIWCGERILAGERYLRERSVYDGDPQNLKWHPECREAAKEHWNDGGEEEFSPGENERPPSPATLEYESWMDVLRQPSLPGVWS